MPIDYRDYHPDWKAISLRIRNERAGGKCEWCGRPNGVIIVYEPKKPDEWRAADGSMLEAAYVHDGTLKMTKVVLTVAHLDHNKKHNDDSNLAALCQRCHLNYDRNIHAQNRRNGRNWRKGQTRLPL